MAKVLIIEDDPRLEQTYDLLFVRDGHTVVRAHDGEEGLQTALSEKPDVILLDLLMPKLDGIGFLERLDVRTSLPGTKVIVFSNMETSELIQQAMSLGAYKYEVKSRFSPRQIAELVNGALADNSDTPVN